MPHIVAILPAAGFGTRMGAESPKQFRLLDGLPVIVFTLRRLADCPSIDEFLIATRPEDAPALSALLAKEKTRPSDAGGPRRRHPAGVRAQRSGGSAGRYDFGAGA